MPMTTSLATVGPPLLPGLMAASTVATRLLRHPCVYRT